MDEAWKPSDSVCYRPLSEPSRITVTHADRRIMLHTGTVGVVGAGREGCTAGMARTEIRQSIVPTHWLHVCHAAFTSKIARCCQVDLEWLRFRTAETSGSPHMINKEY
jgi:hypothetical protein